jgi:hypothetical protein
MAQENLVNGLEAGSVSPAADFSVSRYRQAFEALQPEVAALRDDDLMAVNIDVPNALSVVVGALPQLIALRPELAKFSDPAPLANLDKLEAYALALGHAQTLAQATPSAPEAIQALGETATKLRAQLVSDMNALIGRGLIDRDQIATLKGPPGYLNLAFDLFLLAAVAREHWKNISGKTAISLADIAQAEALADQLLSGVGTRERNKANAANATETRQRLFTLLVNAYDQVRRAVVFLRWDHDDLDEIMPSLYLGRNGRRRQVSPKQESASGPAVSPSEVPSATTPGTATAAAGASAAHTTGLPGGNPFNHT